MAKTKTAEPQVVETANEIKAPEMPFEAVTPDVQTETEVRQAAADQRAKGDADPANVTITVPAPRDNVDVRLTLTVSEKLFADYETMGRKFGRTGEEEMLERLKRCRTHDAMRCLYFNDEQRSALERATGMMALDGDGMVARLENILKLEVGDVKIMLDAKVINRLSTRVYRGQTFDEHLRKVVEDAIFSYCGLQ